MFDPIAAAHGLGVNLVSAQPTGRGQWSSFFARTADGVDVVIKASDSEDWGGALSLTVDRVADLRQRGYPAPGTVELGRVDGTYVWVLERLPGEPCAAAPTGVLLDAVLEAVELQADAPATYQHDGRGRTWAHDVVYADRAGWWTSARNRGTVVREVIERMDAWVRELDPPKPRGDYMHMDLNPGNLLQLDLTLSGIIDLDHLGYGDRCVDLADLAMFSTVSTMKDGRADLPEPYFALRERARAISGEAGWRMGVAYRALAFLGWSGPPGAGMPVDISVAVVTAVLDESQGRSSTPDTSPASRSTARPPQSPRQRGR